MKVHITNLNDGSTHSYPGNTEEEVVARLAPHYPEQAEEAPNLLHLLAALRHDPNLDIVVEPQPPPAIPVGPGEAAAQVAKLYDTDYSAHMSIVLEHLGKRPAEPLSGSSQELLATLTARYPDYAAMVHGQGLKALMEYIMDKHPTDSVAYGEELKNPRFLSPHEMSGFDAKDDYVQDMPAGYPHPKLIGRVEGFSDDSEEV